MMTLIEEHKLRREMRSLRQRSAQTDRSCQHWKGKSEQLEQLLEEARRREKQLEQSNQQLQNEIHSLKDQIASLTVHKNKLAGMLFKTSNKPVSHSTKKRGAQPGHPGTGRTVPERIDQEKTVFLSHCPECDTALERSSSVYQRTVEDLPPQQTVVTRYSIERQYCRHCHKEVSATPKDTLPGLRFGLNLVTLMLFQKYRLRLPLNKIREALRIQHSFSIREGGIQRILHVMKDAFSPEYEQIKQLIRQAPAKHADETSWNIEGKKGWSWLFATPKEALYTMEECRGKGVPEKILGENPTGVLIRDDYGGYRSLPMEQQSCWTHLLRVSREATKSENASEEARVLGSYAIHGSD
jgi:transposase